MDNPVTVNAEIIKTLDPDLTENLSDDTINALISDAQLISISDGFPKFGITSTYVENTLD